MVENMHDIPYLQATHHGPEVVAAMTKLCSEIKSVLPTNMPIGIQESNFVEYSTSYITSNITFTHVIRKSWIFLHSINTAVFRNSF